MPSGSGGADLDGGGTLGRDLAVGWKSLTSLGRECPDGMVSHLGSPGLECRSHGDQLSLSVLVTQGTEGLQSRPGSWTHMTVRPGCQLKWFDRLGWTH